MREPTLKDRKFWMFVAVCLFIAAVCFIFWEKAQGAPNQCAALENTLNDLIGSVGEQAGFHVGLALRATGANELKIALVAHRMRDPDIKAKVVSEWGAKVEAKRQAVLLFSGCR
jgi:hypothetical protein